MSRRSRIGLAVMAGALLGANAAAAQQPAPPTRAALTEHVADWPVAAREAAQAITEKYGPPLEMTESMVTWGPAGPWKRTVVYREEVPHDFPMAHTDVLEQFIDYRVPVELFDDLAEYDGSVIAERTKGELSARCDIEGANFLALNLAHEIVTGEISVEDAREKYLEQVRAMKAGEPAPYTEKLLFEPQTNTADPDKPIG